MNDSASSADGPQDVPSNLRAEEIPTPIIESRPRGVWQLLGGSRLWWLTLGCAIVAGLLVWQSGRETGGTLTIHFPDGHGLRSGDAVRHRGIDVGWVAGVDLKPDLTGVEVRVELTPSAQRLARADTRFWIVRPQVSLVEVSGLETAVGAKYIGVSPGSGDGAPQWEFEGLSAPPADQSGRPGIEVILRGSDAFGLNPGSPVTWRGVEVGQVLSVELAADTRFVDVLTRIDAAYSRLVRPNSRFWVTSGVDLDAGLTGVRLRAESLASIAKGGVAFMTPGEDRREPVPSGHVFTLHREAEKSWTEGGSSASLVDFDLPPTVAVRAEWKQKQLGITRSRSREVNGLLVQLDRSNPPRQVLVVPAQGGTPHEEAIDETWKLVIGHPGDSQRSFVLPTETKGAIWPGGTVLYRFAAPPLAGGVVPLDRIRDAAEPEDCCVVRSVAGGGERSSVVEPVSRLELTPIGAAWRVENFRGNAEDWNGSAVISAVDGKVIGLLVDGREGVVVAPLGGVLSE